LIFDGVRNTFIGATRGLFDTKYPMYMGLLAIWLLGVPLSYLLGFIFHLGVVGIMLGTLFGITVGSLIMLYRWHIISNKY
jgi:MATE family multidrug resistance protein